jgi:hypothetical protein
VIINESRLILVGVYCKIEIFILQLSGYVKQIKIKLPNDY